MGLLLITHDLGVVAEVADRVVVMNAGEIVETGSATEVYHHPQHPYTRRLIGAAPGKGRMHDEPAAGAPLLAVEDVSKAYGAYRALDGVSFALHRGETLAIVGESGSGKSTLARVLLQLDTPSGGRALWKGRDLFAMPPKELFGLRRQMQMVFQDPTQSLNPRMTCARPDRRGLGDPPRDPAEGPMARAGGGAAGTGRAARRLHPALSAPVLRRPAPAHRHRPRPGAGAGADRLRRGRLGARRVDPGAGDRAARPAATRNSASPSSSSPTTCPWCGTSPTASSSCAPAVSSRAAACARSSRRRANPIPGRCWRPGSIPIRRCRPPGAKDGSSVSARSAHRRSPHRRSPATDASAPRPDLARATRNRTTHAAIRRQKHHTADRKADARLGQIARQKRAEQARVAKLENERVEFGVTAHGQSLYRPCNERATDARLRHPARRSARPPRPVAPRPRTRPRRCARGSGRPAARAARRRPGRGRPRRRPRRRP